MHNYRISFGRIQYAHFPCRKYLDDLKGDSYRIRATLRNNGEEVDYIRNMKADNSEKESS